jgi:CubicO group peptidase (beta-lactamase class C family)
MNITPLSRRALLLLAVAGALVAPAHAKPQAEASPDALAKTLDGMLTGLYAKDAPGAVVIAVRDGRMVLRKAYGVADLELGVPLKPDMVFRIGSMTKQFTAVAVLMLVEEGKLAVSDPITKFLPDYPTGGRTITVEHLLTHTSGIKSYTDMDDFLGNLRKDYTVKELIDHFKDQPMEFEPGEKYQYDNSGYFLLGAIIEKASGMGYEAFLKKRIFDVVGMPDTSLESTSRITPRRVHGYERNGGAWVNAEFLSMTQPFSAGGIVSTVDDLAKWDAALYTGKLVRPETLQQAFTPHRLKDGKPIEYGYRVDEKRTLTLTADGGRLYAQPSGGSKTEAIPLSDSEFFYAGSMDRLRFERDAAGRVTALVRQGFARTPETCARTAAAPVERKEVPPGRARHPGEAVRVAPAGRASLLLYEPEARGPQAGCCWVRQWSVPKPSTRSTAWMPTTALPGKRSPRRPRATRSFGSLNVGTTTAALAM